MAEKRFQRLYKRTSSGETQIWDIWVTTVNENGPATIHIEHGLEHGAKQHLQDEVTAGKNANKKNATTAWSQACSEAQSKWEKQMSRKNYGLTVDESAAKRAMAPMLAKVYADQCDKIDWSTAFEQPKLDGFRCGAERDGDQILFTSREGQPFVLPHVAEVLKTVLQDGERFDGELYTPGITLNKIASLVKDPREETAQLFYNVYDTPVALPFAERIAIVQKRLGRTRQVGNVIMVETVPVRSEAELLARQFSRIEAGFEGSMLRWGVLPYQAGKRSSCLLKVKTFKDGEFAIIGAKEGRGTHAGMAVFICKTQNGHEFDCLAPGTHDDKRRAWDDRARYVGKRLTVKYAYMTDTSKPVPFQPVAKRLAEPLK